MGTKVSATLSQGSITFLFFSGFGLGVVIAAIALLGSQIPLKCFDAGNAADWAAAVGTWVIGFAACGLTWQASKSGQAADKAAKRSQLRIMRIQAISLGTLTDKLLSLEEHSVPSMSVRSISGALALKCGSLRLDLPVLDEEDSLEVAVANVEFYALAVQSVAMQFNAINPLPPNVGVTTSNEYRWLRENADLLNGKAIALGEALSERIKL